MASIFFFLSKQGLINLVKEFAYPFQLWSSSGKTVYRITSASHYIKSQEVFLELY